jgi:hypothetical protein
VERRWRPACSGLSACSLKPPQPERRHLPGPRRRGQTGQAIGRPRTRHRRRRVWRLRSAVRQWPSLRSTSAVDRRCGTFLRTLRDLWICRTTQAIETTLDELARRSGRSGRAPGSCAAMEGFLDHPNLDGPQAHTQWPFPASCRGLVGAVMFGFAAPAASAPDEDDRARPLGPCDQTRLTTMAKTRVWGTSWSGLFRTNWSFCQSGSVPRFLFECHHHAVWCQRRRRRGDTDPMTRGGTR